MGLPLSVPVGYGRVSVSLASSSQCSEGLANLLKAWTGLSQRFVNFTGLLPFSGQDALQPLADLFQPERPWVPQGDKLTVVSKFVDEFRRRNQSGVGSDKPSTGLIRVPKNL